MKINMAMAKYGKGGIPWLMFREDLRFSLTAKAGYTVYPPKKVFSKIQKQVHQDVPFTEQGHTSGAEHGVMS